MFNYFMIAMFLSVFVASLSQVLLKKSTFCKYESLLREYLNPFVIGGYVLMVLSMLLTVYAYSGMDYKNGPLIESFGNVIVLMLSYVFFKERISARKLVGMICIMFLAVLFVTLIGKLVSLVTNIVTEIQFRG